MFHVISEKFTTTNTALVCRVDALKEEAACLHRHVVDVAELVDFG